MSSVLTPIHFKLNYRDYCAIPNDGKRHEILDGEWHVSPSPNARHQETLGNLHVALSGHVRRTRCGKVFIAPFDVLLSEHDIVQPDLVFVSAGRFEIITEANIKGVPDLLVEILSPTAPEYDRRDKFRRYASLGVANYWIVDPLARTIEEYVLAGTDYAMRQRTQGNEPFRPAVFSDLTINLSEVWPAD